MAELCYNGRLPSYRDTSLGEPIHSSLHHLWGCDFDYNLVFLRTDEHSPSRQHNNKSCLTSFPSAFLSVNTLSSQHWTGLVQSVFLQPSPSLTRYIGMEEDVKALMSVVDEALWNSAWLFSSTCDLSRRTNYSSSLPFSATLSSNSEPTTSLLYSWSTSSFSPTNTTPHKSNTPTVPSSLPLPFRSLPKSPGPTIHACNISPSFASAFTHSLTHPATCRESTLAPRGYQAYPTSREHIN